MRDFACNRPEGTRHAPRSELALHRHDHGYIAVVLNGSYDELSPDGRFACGAAALICHPPFHLHKNRFGDDGAIVLNLPLPDGTVPSSSYRVRRGANVGDIARLAERNILAASRAAMEELSGATTTEERAPDWLSDLADALRRDSLAGASSLIGALAKRAGVSPEHAARRFKAYYGVSPSAYRREHRVRRALSLIRSGVAAADTACRCGYADQSHLVKEVRKVTGRTPGAFRSA